MSQNIDDKSNRKITNKNEENKYHSSIKLNGRYKNPWPTYTWPSYVDIFKFMVFKRPYSLDPKDVIEEKLPVVKPTWTIPDNGINVTWLGHASVAVQFEGITILTDPVFSERCSPSSYVGPKRYRPNPCAIEDLPKINAVVISHTHYDHLDLATVKQLHQRFGQEIHWFVPIGLKEWFRSIGISNVLELDWWQAGTISGNDTIEFVFTPAQHWCKRTLFDDNKVLWGSWSVLGAKHKFFFAGDTGYCEGFKQIGERFGPFDVSAIPIGAYEPRHFMKHNHANPADAVLIHQDVQSKTSLGIHWGTFHQRSHEHYLDPPKHLKESLTQRNLAEKSFITLKHGESKVFT